jgi:hypothetical protein
MNALIQAGAFALVMCAPVILVDLSWASWKEERRAQSDR